MGTSGGAAALSNGCLGAVAEVKTRRRMRRSSSKAGLSLKTLCNLDLLDK
jgi:hypothetical protein